MHGEKIDWIPRVEIILSDRWDKSLEPYEHFAQFNSNAGKSLNQLLGEFEVLRET